MPQRIDSVQHAVPSEGIHLETLHTAVGEGHLQGFQIHRYGAGLLLRSFITTIQEDPGFDPAGITLLDLSLPEYRYPDQPSRISFAQELLERAANVSGAQSVALGRNLPISGSNMTSPLMVEGSTGTTAAVQVAMVTEGGNYGPVAHAAFADVAMAPLEVTSGA